MGLSVNNRYNTEIYRLTHEFTSYITGIMYKFLNEYN